MKKSFLILSLLALTFIACPPPEPEPQPEPEKPTLSKIDITDAAALFVEPSGTDAGKIFKIKKDLTTIEEVKYTNTDGSSADMGNLKASYVINAHNDYAIIGFAADPNKAKTYDFELVADKAYLVRKSDGKVFSLDEYGYPSCDAVMASGKYIYYPVGEIKEISTDQWEFAEQTQLTTYGNKLIRIDASGTTPTGKNILPTSISSFSRFLIDKNENIFINTPTIGFSIITEMGEHIRMGVLTLRARNFNGYIYAYYGGSNIFNNATNEMNFISAAPLEDSNGSFEYSTTIMSNESPVYTFATNTCGIIVYKNLIIQETQDKDIFSGTDNQYIYYKPVTDNENSLNQIAPHADFSPVGGEKSIAIVSPQSPSDYFNVYLINIETLQSQLYSIFLNLHSMLIRDNTVYAIGTSFEDNSLNIIKCNPDGWGNVELRSKPYVQEGGKVILVDMEYKGWKSLPSYPDMPWE